MIRLTNLRILSMALLLGTLGLAFSASNAQTPAAQPQATTDTPTASEWTTEQLVTSTVHDAWLLSGKDEGKFFEMVKALAELSAEKRGLSLPDSKAAGMRMGAAIKRMAKADTDQLLYVVVDKAVLAAAHGSPRDAGSGAAKTPASAQ